MQAITSFYLIRHGETVLNREDRFRGASEVDLNDLGREQARELGLGLAKTKFTAILSSPMERALYTAKQIAAHHEHKIRQEPAFRNIDLGPWNGKLKGEVKKEHPQLWDQWIHHPEALAVPGAENLRQVQTRSFTRLEELVTEFAGGQIALIAHSTVIKPILARALELKEPWLWRFHLDHASYTVLEHHPDRGWCISTLNQTNHLTQIRREPA